MRFKAQIVIEVDMDEVVEPASGDVIEWRILDGPSDRFIFDSAETLADLECKVQDYLRPHLPDDISIILEVPSK